MSEITVICENISKAFGDDPIVRQLSLNVPHGDIMALLGPSGCGKTTTLRLIAGLETLDSGRIEIDDRVVNEGRYHMPIEKRRVGMVFQDYALFPHLTVGKNVAFGLSGRNTAPRVAEMLALVGLSGLEDRMPHELSGGQQQRVALARALAPQPVVLLLDEPFSNLDAALRVEMRQEVRELLKKAEITAVFVTHDQEEALYMGDQVAVMNNGWLEQVGTPEDVFHRPASRFVADFMGQTDFIPGEITAQGVASPIGALKQGVSGTAGTAVEIAIRPHNVALFPANGQEANARVLDRQFVGIAYIYRVALADGSIVHSWQPYTVQFAPQEEVRAFVRDKHVLPVFERE